MKGKELLGLAELKKEDFKNVLDEKFTTPNNKFIGLGPQREKGTQTPSRAGINIVSA
ncbi:MAG: hypothetical protein MRQ09_04845 [Candidatus Midichloria sp.]|nr:hypothetical protein [Candidatus Midichloria sp.]